MIRHAQHGRGKVLKVERGRAADEMVATIAYDDAGVRRLSVGLSDPPPPPAIPRYRAGDRVRHATFGAGRVIGVDAAQPDRPIVTVAFDRAGTRKMSAREVPLTLPRPS